MKLGDFQYSYTEWDERADVLTICLVCLSVIFHFDVGIFFEFTVNSLDLFPKLLINLNLIIIRYPKQKHHDLTKTYKNLEEIANDYLQKLLFCQILAQNSPIHLRGRPKYGRQIIFKLWVQQEEKRGES